MICSIVIPCYNSQDTIVRALESIVNQSFDNYEIIIVDDGSTDNTKSVIADFMSKHIDKSIRYIYQANAGPSSARNHGCQYVKGEYIAFLDSDDAWHPQKLEISICVMQNNNIQFLGHNYSYSNNLPTSYVANDCTSIIKKLKKISFYHVLIKNFAVTPSIIISRELFEDFNETMMYAEDHELWLRILFKHRAYVMDIPLVILGRKPLSKGGLSANRWLMRKGEINMYIQSTRYSRLTYVCLPCLVLFSLAKFVIKELTIRYGHAKA